MLRPAGDTYVRRLRTFYFALPSEVFLHQANYVSSEEPAYNTRADNATSIFLLTKFMFFVRSIFYR
jgi:hypothetical protein